MASTAYLPIVADRYGACVRHLFLVGLDMTGIDMRAQIRLDGDTPGPPLVDLLTVGNGNAEGLRLVEVTTAAGVPTSHIAIVINETSIERLPYMGAVGDATQLRWDMQIMIAGRKRRLARGEFEITGDGVTGADAAPLNRPQGYGRAVQPVSNMWSAARLTFGEEQVTVTIDGTDLVAPFADKAERAASAAAGSAAAGAQDRATAQMAAASAVAIGNFVAGGLVAGEAATAVGKFFSVEHPAGVLSFRVRTPAGSSELGNTARDTVSPEMFGVPGAGGNDNALFTAAFATGKPVKALGPLYKLDRLKTARSINLEVGALTEMRNVQAGGAKDAGLTIEGGFVGSATGVLGFQTINVEDVTALRIGELARRVRVVNATSFAVGDTIRIYEDMPLTEATRKGTPDPEFEDLNYHQYATVESISGNTITTQEYFAWPFDVANAMKVRKVVFVEGVTVTGGRWTGGNQAGGGLHLSFCRHARVGDIHGSGFGPAEDANMGGPPVFFSDCWQSYRGPLFAQWCTFVAQHERNQSCSYGPIAAGKKTTNGGMIIGGDIFCSYGLITQDSPGDDNGDQISFANGARRNTFAGILGVGSNCYTTWIRQGCDDNTFGVFNSFHGETAAIQDYADRNIFRSVKVRGHPSAGVILGGNFTQVDIDFEGEGTGVQFGAPYLDEARDSGILQGHRVTGRSVCTALGGSLFYDLVIAGRLIDSVVDLIGGPRGAMYGANAVENYSNEILLSGVKPYALRGRRFLMGEPHRDQIVDVPANPTIGSGQPLLVPGGDARVTGDGRINLPIVAGDDGVSYEVTLTRNQGYPGAWSRYWILTRQGEIFLMREEVGMPADGIPADFSPRLRIVPGSPQRLEIFVGAASPVAQVLAEIRRV